ncbi:hypothetical protein GCM10009534_54040 [Kribbella sandramycini]
MTALASWFRWLACERRPATPHAVGLPGVADTVAREALACFSEVERRTGGRLTQCARAPGLGSPRRRAARWLGHGAKELARATGETQHNAAPRDHGYASRPPHQSPSGSDGRT